MFGWFDLVVFAALVMAAGMVWTAEFTVARREAAWARRRRAK